LTVYIFTKHRNIANLTILTGNFLLYSILFKKIYMYMYIKYIIYKEIGFFLSNASKSLNTAFFPVK